MKKLPNFRNHCQYFCFKVSISKLYSFLYIRQSKTGQNRPNVNHSRRLIFINKLKNWRQQALTFILFFQHRREIDSDNTFRFSPSPPPCGHRRKDDRPGLLPELSGVEAMQHWGRQGFPGQSGDYGTMPFLTLISGCSKAEGSEQAAKMACTNRKYLSKKEVKNKNRLVIG